MKPKMPTPKGQRAGRLSSAGFMVLVIMLSLSARAQSKLPFTGSYDFTRRDEDGQLDILQLSETKIKYQIMVVTQCCGHNIAEDEGIIELHGNVAYDNRSEEGMECCPLHFHFGKDRVTITEGEGECCWGMDATTAGLYLKTKRAPDFTKTQESAGLTYSVAVSRAYFYDDSSLLQQKKAYLIAGDTIVQRGNTDHAIYVEIYNRKRLTLTYGWLALRDLKREGYKDH